MLLEILSLSLERHKCYRAGIEGSRLLDRAEPMDRKLPRAVVLAEFATVLV